MTSSSRSVRVDSSGGVPDLGVGRWAKSSISRRVIEGWSSASPSATTRTALESCSAGESFSRNALAPAFSASYTYSS